MTVKWSRLTTSEALEIERLLRSGLSAMDVHRATGRSMTAVRAVRDACGISPSTARGRRPEAAPTPATEGPEGGEEPSGNPCDLLYAERPNQEQWLDLLRTADDQRLRQMRRAVCEVLGAAARPSEETLASLAIADRRTADQLAAAYLAELGVRSSC